MRQLKVTWKGTTPLLMHDCRTVNPTHPLRKEIAKYTGKRNKTDDDYEIISDLEWLSGLYYTEIFNEALTPAKDAYIYIPAENIEATIKCGAVKFKKGKDISRFVSMVGIHAPLEFYDDRTVAEIWEDGNYRDVRMVNVMRNKIVRTRPRFERWEVTFDLRFSEDHIDIETIKNAIDYAGEYVGCCDFRSKYGHFVARYGNVYDVIIKKDSESILAHES